MEKTKPLSVDEYIAGYPEEVQTKLREMRSAIRDSAPDAEETISYAMPAYKLHGNLVYFAAFEKHIGFYALPTGHAAFAEELKGFKTGKGSVQFPLSEPMPIELIKKMVHFRVQENMDQAASKAK